MARWFLLLLTPLLLAQPAAAYDRDFHYLWTYYLALQVGFSERQAYQVASAAQAVDDDEHVAPLIVVTPTEAFHSSYHADANPRVGIIWRDFHCFAEYPLQGYSLPTADLRELTRYSPIIQTAQTLWEASLLGLVYDNNEAVQAARQQRRERLRDLVSEQGNAGPLLHYDQDCFPHGDFTDLRGHALMGHAPDWISFDEDMGWAATMRTLDDLQWLRTQVLGMPRRDPNFSEVQQAYRALLDANPVTDLLPDGTTKADGWKAVSDEAFPAPLGQQLAGLVWSDIAPDAIDTTNPDIDAARRAIAALVDQHFGPRPPGTGMAATHGSSPPAQWLHYDYDEHGRSSEASYPIEQPRLRFEAGAVTGQSIQGDLVREQVSVQLVAEQIVDLPSSRGFGVFVSCTTHDGTTNLRSTLYLGNETRTLSASLTRPADGRGGSWICTAQAPGLDDSTGGVLLDPVSPPEAPRVPDAADVELQAALEQVQAARARAATARAQAESACALGARWLEPLRVIDGQELVSARDTAVRLQGLAAPLAAALPDARARLASAQQRAERVALADQALRSSADQACAASRAGRAGEAGLHAHDAGTALRRIHSGRAELDGLAERLRERAAAAQTAATQLADAEAITQRPLDSHALAQADQALADARTASRQARRAMNDVAGIAAVQRDRWQRELIPHHRDNQLALSALSGAWTGLLGHADQAQSCLAPLAADALRARLQLDDLTRLRTSAQAEVSAAREVLPGPSLIDDLQQLAARAETLAWSASIASGRADATAASAQSCADSALQEPAATDHDTDADDPVQQADDPVKAPGDTGLRGTDPSDQPGGSGTSGGEQCGWELRLAPAEFYCACFDPNHPMGRVEVPASRCGPPPG